MKDALTTAELARRIGCTPWPIYDAIRVGKVVPPVRLGRSYLWAETDVEAVRRAMGRAKDEGVSRG